MYTPHNAKEQSQPLEESKTVKELDKSLKKVLKKNEEKLKEKGFD